MCLILLLPRNFRRNPDGILNKALTLNSVMEYFCPTVWENSQDEYKDVTLEEDNYFARFKVTKSDESDGRKWEDPELGFCTETLAWIYADQGYYAEAKKIYSRLMLRYPEKIAYFATLIEKLDEDIKK